MSEEKLEEKVKPIRVECEAGKEYSFCTCGHSKKIPYCDESHKKVNEEQGTSYKPFKIIPEQDSSIWISSSNWIEQKNKKIK